MSGIGISHFRHILRRTACNDAAAAFAAFRSHVDNIVRRFDHIQIVLNHDYRITSLGKLMQNLDQFMHVRKMKARRRLVQNINRFSRAPFTQFCGKLDPLRFTAGKFRRRLAQADVG